MQTKKYLQRLLAISFVGLWFNGILNANVGILSQFAAQNNNDWIGPLSIALNFLGSGLGALYHSYIGKYPYNNIIFLGSLGWNIFCGFSVLFLFLGFQDFVNLIIILGSFVCGLLISMFYNGLFNYVNECGQRDGQSQKYFGINMLFYQPSGLLGNALSAAMIEPLGQKMYSCVMLGLGFLVSCAYLAFPEFDNNDQQSIKDQESTQPLHSGEVSPLRQQAQPEQEQLQIPKKKIVPWQLVFSFALSGTIISFLIGKFSILFFQYYKQMPNEELNKLTFQAFIIQGFGEFIGGVILIVFSKKLTNLPLAFTINGISFLFAIVLVYTGFEQDSKSLIYIGALLVGVADCLCFSMALTIGGVWRESGMSLFNLGQSGAVAVLSICCIFIGLGWLSVIYTCIFLMSTFALYLHRHQLQKINQGSL